MHTEGGTKQQLLLTDLLLLLQWGSISQLSPANVPLLHYELLGEGNILLSSH